jgi:centromere protein C
VIGYVDSLPARPLPMGAGRLKSEGKVVCLAAQAFNISNADSPFPGYLMGNLILPPKGIKDAESVGTCAQTFTCVYGQPGSIEVAYSDPDVRDGTLDPMTASRFFVKQGDMFRIPPGNCYRVENHSKEAEAYLTWTIIRPNEAA